MVNAVRLMLWDWVTVVLLSCTGSPLPVAPMLAAAIVKCSTPADVITLALLATNGVAPNAAAVAVMGNPAAVAIEGQAEVLAPKAGFARVNSTNSVAPLKT